MDVSSPAVSVVIPVKNESVKIKACIDGILSQTVPVQEIIVIDSGSTDGTLEILREYSIVKIVEIPPAEFNHGETRNLGVRMASGEFVLMTVGDARPFNNQWIEELLKGFVDQEVAGVCGQQVVPHEKDKNPVEWYQFYSQPVIIRNQFSVEEFNLIQPEKKRDICGWDDVTAMYRKRILLDLPFRKTSYSEDVIWARDAIFAGYAIVYNFNARVFHYHNEDADFVYKRTFTTMYFRYRYFGFINNQPAITLFHKLRILKILYSRLGLHRDILKWYNYNIRNLRSVSKAVLLFKQKLKEGEAALDLIHNQLCGKPPIPLK